MVEHKGSGCLSSQGAGWTSVLSAMNHTWETNRGVPTTSKSMPVIPALSNFQVLGVHIALKTAIPL
jgi:hypothetical protein